MLIWRTQFCNSVHQSCLGILLAMVLNKLYIVVVFKLAVFLGSKSRAIQIPFGLLLYHLLSYLKDSITKCKYVSI
ncbi:hypothetical protein MKW94_024598, partial [Papaver nudicaule]|nr:hypothetical protein [Papaver nudicaule]